MRGKRILACLLAALLLVSAIPTAEASIGQAKTFSDVPSNAWYKDALDKLSMLDIVHGDEGGTFRPEAMLTRGEFITMLFNSLETATMQCIDENGNPGNYLSDTSIHWSQPYWNALNDMGIIAGSGIKCSGESLNGTITRNEMAVLITNSLYKDGFEEKITLNNVSSVIKDYSAIPASYQYYVEQAFGKGVLSGYSDGSFQGGNGLKRSEAVSVIYRMKFANDRTKISAATTVKPDYTPMATQWQKNGWINAYGTASAELRQVLFGDSNKAYFTSLTEAGSHIVAVTVPVWKIDNSGQKYASTDVVYVNQALSDDVLGIFTQIFNDPERFPIISTSSFRNTDTMRHSWGCAIDINAWYNAECRAYYNDGTVKFTSGTGWWPQGTEHSMFSGGLSEPSPYSIGAGSSVVKAFADYGWGWGGQGYSVRNDNTQKFDYMHFSIMASGG